MSATTFQSLKISSDLLATVAELGFVTPTPIQAACIPILFQKNDLIGQAQTGSGKTAAFAIPILQALDLAKRDVQAMILCPTRELSQQVAREIRKLARRMNGLQVLVLAGGQPSRPQTAALAKGVHIVVGTPGRTLDHIERDRLDLAFIQVLVLDEADRMLDMGFQDEVEAILRAVPGTRQTALFSATFPDAIEKITRQFLHLPQRVMIEANPELAPSIRQIAYECDSQGNKTKTLLQALQQHKPKSTLIFCNQKAIVGDLSEALTKAGINASALHGDLEQRDRDRVLAMFRNHSTRVLIATDVAARGLDIENLDMVINYDLPYQPEIYIHRIGRTGRAGKSGLAVSLVNSQERGRLNELARTPGISFEHATLIVKKPNGVHHASELANAEMQTLVISGGRKDKLRPGDILGALTGDGVGLAATSVGKIEIHERFSYVAVATAFAEKALRALQSGRIKSRRFQVKKVE